MKVKVRFFASCREIAGKNQVELQVQKGETLSSLLEIVRRDFPRLSLADILVAVNQEFAGPGYVLQEGDEVALIPPVSGG
jgi:molybdopterin converting factor subunit 1